MNHDESEVVSDMVDLTDVDVSRISELHRDSDSALARAVRQLLADAKHPGETLAGFQASL
jgi:FXSXX-COOH protein